MGEHSPTGIFKVPLTKICICLVDNSAAKRHSVPSGKYQAYYFFKQSFPKHIYFLGLKSGVVFQTMHTTHTPKIQSLILNHQRFFFQNSSFILVVLVVVRGGGGGGITFYICFWFKRIKERETKTTLYCLPEKKHIKLILEEGCNTVPRTPVHL